MRLDAVSSRALIFQAVPRAIAAMQQVEPKHGMDVAETVHPLFKMTTI